MDEIKSWQSMSKVDCYHKGHEDERKLIIDMIRFMQHAQHSNFISGNDLIDAIYNAHEKKDAPFEYEGWD